MLCAPLVANWGLFNLSRKFLIANVIKKPNESKKAAKKSKSEVVKDFIKDQAI